MFLNAPKRRPSSGDAKGRIADSSPIILLSFGWKVSRPFSMSSAFTNRRKPRKVGGDDEENDSGEQGQYLVNFADGSRSSSKASADIYQILAQ